MSRNIGKNGMNSIAQSDGGECFVMDSVTAE